MVKRTSIIPIRWVPERYQNYDTGPAPWIYENNDTDRDGVPNYMDEEPLNPNINTLAPRFRTYRRPMEMEEEYEIEE